MNDILKITEIVNPITAQDNPKGIIDKTIERQCHTFKSLKKLANFSRSHFHLIYTQATFKNVPRQAKHCEQLDIGSHLLWIDLDANIDIKDLKKRFRKSNMKGFFYYTSKFYVTGERRVRMCVVTENKVTMDHQAQYYARQFLVKLGYDNAFMNNLDTKIYSYDSYSAPVMNDDGTLVSDYDEKGKSLFIFNKGKPFKWIEQITFQKKNQNLRIQKSLKETPSSALMGILLTNYHLLRT